MSKRRIPKYRYPLDSDLSLLVYLDDNGRLMHKMFPDRPIGGVLEWLNGNKWVKDFFIEYKINNDDEDDDEDDEDYEDSF